MPAINIPTGEYFDRSPDSIISVVTTRHMDEESREMQKHGQVGWKTRLRTCTQRTTRFIHEEEADGKYLPAYLRMIPSTFLFPNHQCTITIIEQARIEALLFFTRPERWTTRLRSRVVRQALLLARRQQARRHGGGRGLSVCTHIHRKRKGEEGYLLLSLLWFLFPGPRLTLRGNMGRYQCIFAQCYMIIPNLVKT
jgi:hypothetical protein